MHSGLVEHWLVHKGACRSVCLYIGVRVTSVCLYLGLAGILACLPLGIPVLGLVSSDHIGDDADSELSQFCERHY